MNSFIYVVFDDGKVGIINETCHGYSFDKKWSPLMPFIQGHFVYRSEYDYESPDESRIEMGLYCIEENRIINAPFVWNHIKIKTIEVIKGETNEERGKFKAEVIIYRENYSCQNIYEHTFVVKNGVFFFMDSILGTINHLLDKGYSIEDIDFDFLDKQCMMFNFLAANHQLYPKFELCHEFYTHGYYDLISTMKLEVYNNGCGNRNGDSHWLEVKLFLKTTDKYIVHVITTVLKEKVNINHRTENLYAMADRNSTIFSFTTCKYQDDSSCCGTYKPTLANDEVHKEIREIYAMELLVEGAKLLNEDIAIEYLTTNHKEENRHVAACSKQGGIG